MGIYYASMNVAPEPENVTYGSVEMAIAHVFVRADEADSGRVLIGRVLVDQYWRPEEAEFAVHSVTIENFEGRDLGRNCFREAEEKGYSSAYVGVRSEEPAMDFPMDKGINLGPNPGGFHRRQKFLSRRGRCLHYDAGEGCGSIVAAHSIQRSGMLSKIARGGQVYVLSSQIRDLARTGGHLALRLRGIGQVSTFRGMCDKHDDEVFRPIDAGTFEHSSIQVSLYAYRSLCREVFVKQNAVEQLEATLTETRHSRSLRQQVSWMLEGTRRGNRQLQRHKQLYDDAIRDSHGDEFRFRSYRADGRLPYAVSGVLYPYADFEGEYIQDLSANSNWDALTFATARSSVGDILLFGWHSSSDEACNALLASLDRRSASGASLDDLLTRYVIGNAENLALAPAWVESLSEEQRASLEEFASQSIDVSRDLSSESLQHGLEGFVESRLTPLAERLA
jgi:hypothetical protein